MNHKDSYMISHKLHCANTHDPHPVKEKGEAINSSIEIENHIDLRKNLSRQLIRRL